MKCGLTVSSPTSQISTLLCHFQCNHMVGLMAHQTKSPYKIKKKIPKDKLVIAHSNICL